MASGVKKDGSEESQASAELGILGDSVDTTALPLVDVHSTGVEVLLPSVAEVDDDDLYADEFDAHEPVQLVAVSVTGPDEDHGTNQADLPFEPVTLMASRIDAAQANRERDDQLTLDRVLGSQADPKPIPESGVALLVHRWSGGRWRLKPSRAQVEQEELRDRTAVALSGPARSVAVLSRKGGVGKTTVTALLGMALADAREDRVVALDANPDRGTLADRVSPVTVAKASLGATLSGEVRNFSELSEIIIRDRTRLDILAPEADPHRSEAFNGKDYRQAADVASRFYSVMVTDTGTGLVHQAMRATLERAQQLVIVSALSADSARLAAETLSWLEAHGHAEGVRRAIVVLNQTSPGKSKLNVAQIQSHFESRVHRVIRLPHDPLLALGGTIDFRALQPATKRAAKELAASVVSGLVNAGPSVAVSA